MSAREAGTHRYMARILSTRVDEWIAVEFLQNGGAHFFCSVLGGAWQIGESPLTQSLSQWEPCLAMWGLRMYCCLPPRVWWTCVIQTRHSNDIGLPSLYSLWHVSSRWLLCPDLAPWSPFLEPGSYIEGVLVPAATSVLIYIRLCTHLVHPLQRFA